MENYSLINKYLYNQDWNITVNREHRDRPGNTALRVEPTSTNKVFRVVYPDGRAYDRSGFLANPFNVSLEDLVRTVSPRLSYKEFRCLNTRRLLGTAITYGLLSEALGYLTDIGV